MVLSKGSHVVPTHAGIRQDRRVQDADDPDGGWHGVQRRRIHVRELRRLAVVILREALPDELQDVPRRCGSTTAGSAVSQGWCSVRTTPCKAVPGTARLALVRRRVCSRAATVGAALLPP